MNIHAICVHDVASVPQVAMPRLIPNGGSRPVWLTRCSETSRCVGLVYALYIFIYIYIYIYIYLSIYIYIYIYFYLCIHIYICVDRYACVYVTFELPFWNSGLRGPLSGWPTHNSRCVDFSAGAFFPRS